MPCLTPPPPCAKGENMKTHFLILKRFNNYFNRKIIKYDTLENYQEHSEGFFIPINKDGTYTRFDFNPHDNVMTETIIDNLEFDPDYLIVFDDEENIISRWFVMEQTRNRNGQWNYHLRRDVIVDNFNSLLKAPIFVEKGMLLEDDPFIVNDEGMSLNQIKKREILLKDKSQTAWIIGYLARNTAGADIPKIQAPTEDLDINYITLGDIASDLECTEQELIEIINFGETDLISTYFTDGLEMQFYLQNDAPGPIDMYYYFRCGFSGDFAPGNTWHENAGEGDIFVHPTLFKKGDLVSNEQLDILANNFASAVQANASSWKTHIKEILERNSYFTYKQLEKLRRYSSQNTLIYYNGEYYRLNITDLGTSTKYTRDIPNDGSNIALSNTVATTINLTSPYYELTSSHTLREIITYDVSAIIRMEKLSDSAVIPEINTSLSSGRNITGDQEYDIIAIPLSIRVYDGEEFSTNENYARRIASAIGIREDAKVYDLQLLPYCPVPNLIDDINHINISDLTVNVDFNYIYYTEDGNDYKAGIMLYIKKSTFGTIINQEITSNKGKKVLSNCYMWRLTSPNYQGSFEFNIAKNGGRVAYFNVFCTYKPYTPIIKVAPNFEWLYGSEFQDNRGLVCGGDFSLPRVSDAWINYQLNNKNYQNIFNREIQHMDFMQGIEMRNQLISGSVGILTDSAKGAVAGGMAGGGPWGAVAGGIIGGATSAIGFAVDVDTMARTHRENKQLAIDKYNYQLGNIKALPYTLTKVGSFDAISKIFPFIEEYCCSDKEIEAFEAKIKYESMTVMRIGTINEFMNYDLDLHYFKGSLIRNDEIADDPHILNAIYEELLKGVYI